MRRMRIRDLNIFQHILSIILAGRSTKADNEDDIDVRTSNLEEGNKRVEDPK